MKLKEKLCNFLSPNNAAMIERLKKDGNFNFTSIAIIIGMIAIVFITILVVNFIVFSVLVYLASIIFNLEFNWTGDLLMYAIYLFLNLVLPENL